MYQTILTVDFFCDLFRGRQYMFRERGRDAATWTAVAGWSSWAAWLHPVDGVLRVEMIPNSGVFLTIYRRLGIILPRRPWNFSRPLAAAGWSDRPVGAFWNWF